VVINNRVFNEDNNYWRHVGLLNTSEIKHELDNENDFSIFSAFK